MELGFRSSGILAAAGNMVRGGGLLLVFCGIQTLIFLFLVVAFMKRRNEDERKNADQFYRIPEFDGDGFHENGLYRRASVYVNSLPAAQDTEFTTLFTATNSAEISLRLDANRTVTDSFLGAKLWWKNEEDGHGRRAFVLRVRKKDKDGVLRPYLQHVQAVAEEISGQSKELRLFTNFNQRWRSAPFRHPATFATVAMEPDVKRWLKSDLETFMKGRQYYLRVGRSWKRNYLFYGATGTGKSTTITAIANFLNFDIYVLELSQIADDSELKILVQQTGGRSILVVEDLDEFFPALAADKNLTIGRTTTGVTLSGVLNILDGIWSCSEEQRIMVFTMKSRDGIDPAILRAGRLDVHVYFPACTFAAFKILACNYLGLKDHKLFPLVEESIQAGSSLTPAEIGEIMILNRSSPSRALKSVINALQSNNRQARRCRISYPSDDEGDLPGSGRIFRREILSLTDLRKLYNFLRLKNRRKTPQLSYDAKEA
ncbi:AAA-ATPase [Nymphaea thermarum]|nr:AAA-ATPase [Nymphaea thermarum]